MLTDGECRHGETETVRNRIHSNISKPFPRCFLETVPFLSQANSMCIVMTCNPNFPVPLGGVLHDAAVTAGGEGITALTH